jgi:hypothetical protein
MDPYFQVGVVVPNLERAMEELTRGLGVQWMAPQDRQSGPYRLRVTFSRDAPYIELIEGSPGSPWDTTHGPHLHHLGFWADDIETDKQRLAEAGMSVELEGNAPFGGGWSYHRGPHSGFRIELCDVAGRTGFYKRWQLPTSDDRFHAR